MEKNPIDVTIYMQKMSSSETINEMLTGMSKKEEIENPEKLRETFLSKLELKAMENYVDYGDPILDEEQFNSVVIESLVEVTLEELMSKGLIEADFDVEKGENVYMLNEEYKKKLEENGGEI
jgi:hypothetical protein